MATTISAKTTVPSSAAVSGSSAPRRVGVYAAIITDSTGCGSELAEPVGEALPLLASTSSLVESNDVEEDTQMTDKVAKVANNNVAIVHTSTPAEALASRPFLLFRRFRDPEGLFINFSSLPLFVYTTSNTTQVTSADGIGVGREIAVLQGVASSFCETLGFRTIPQLIRNQSCQLALCPANVCGGSDLNCLPLGSNIDGTAHSSSSTLQHHPMSATSTLVAGAATSVAAAAVASYQHQLNLSQHSQLALAAHHLPHSNRYHLHHSNGSIHPHTHSEQTKSLQELQNEVGALLEFRDLVIETFPDLKHRMASMSTAAAVVGGVASVPSASISTNALTTSGLLLSGTSPISRREWEPGIRAKRKLTHKEPSTTAVVNSSGGASIGAAASGAPPLPSELSSSSLSRSRSNSHSGKKEPKSGENNGSVVQDSGFSTETSSSKDGHSASSTNGAMPVGRANELVAAIAAGAHPHTPADSDDELMALLEVIHKKSSHLREKVEQLQNYGHETLQAASDVDGGEMNAPKEAKGGDLTPEVFRTHMDRREKEDLQLLRKERDNLQEKLAEMEAETRTGRIKAAKMVEQMDELTAVKGELEEQLKLAIAQNLDLISKLQQQQQQQQQQHTPQQVKSSSGYAGPSVNAGTTTAPLNGGATSNAVSITFQPQSVATPTTEVTKNSQAFHQSGGSDNKQQKLPLGRLDGIVSTPGGRNSKCRTTDSKRFQAILLETNVVELQRHLLTLTVQNQVLTQKLEQSSKSKTHLIKRLDRSKEDMDDLRFQLEEKNIELEGTKAQLRVLESRMGCSTPITGSLYSHSQHDYETNRSSTSTTLMPSRRSNTPLLITDSSAPPPPHSNQLSTPSMKAMTHLHLDEAQQHSSSTESTHDLQQESPRMAAHKLMSVSVGGTSPFATSATASLKQQQYIRKLSATSKPSKIPLAGSKAPAHFIGKPPTGRLNATSRSPPLAVSSGPGLHTSHSSSSNSTKSSLSRSTGNLLYAQSSNSLKHAESAQSMRKDATSLLSTNTSRSSTSSIPIPTTPFSSRTAPSHTTPSPRALQNSPLPKHKRDSLTSRVRHLDSLSRVYQQQQQQQQHNSSSDSNNSAQGCVGHAHNNASHLIASTPKTSVVTQLNSALRKELQLSSNSFSHGSQPFLRRATGGSGAAVKTGSTDVTSAATTTRRFSSASTVGARIAGARTQSHDNNARTASSSSSGATVAAALASAHINGGSAQQHNAAQGADSDSGKVRTLRSTFLGWLKI